jgi:hypothetical protein
MLKILAIVAGVIVVALGGVLAYATTKPDVFRVERSITVNAPPEKIHPLINDFRAWRDWSPYEDREPDLKRTYSQPASGKGAVYSWDGEKMGAGRMEILDAPAPSRVTIKLDFYRPFEASNTAEFVMAPSSGGTRVTWAMSGPNMYIGKVMSVFMDIDKMVGTDFEVGLQKLKERAERS